eukprot:691800-Hanusia_phi.AAC.1
MRGTGTTRRLAEVSATSSSVLVSLMRGLTGHGLTFLSVPASMARSRLSCSLVKSGWKTSDLRRSSCCQAVRESVRAKGEEKI